MFAFLRQTIGLHMGPNKLRYVTCHFLLTMTSLSTLFIKGHVGFVQLLKWQCRTLFFTHVEPYYVRMD